jgi:TIR domain
MNILISWSNRHSHELAKVLADWLPRVIPGVQPWLSERDIDKGSDWFEQLNAELRAARHCIICVTPENIGSPWLYYEAGAVKMRSSLSGNALVCPYLLGVEPSSLSGTPLSQLQCTTASEDETWRLIRTLNRRSDTASGEGLLRGNFQHCWPELQGKIQIIRESIETATAAQKEAIEKVLSLPKTSESRSQDLVRSVGVREPGTKQRFLQRLQGLADATKRQVERYANSKRREDAKAYLKQLGAEMGTLAESHDSMLSEAMRETIQKFRFDLNATGNRMFSTDEDLFAEARRRCEDFEDLNRRVEIFLD